MQKHSEILTAVPKIQMIKKNVTLVRTTAGTVVEVIDTAIAQ